MLDCLGPTWVSKKNNKCVVRKLCFLLVHCTECVKLDSNINQYCVNLFQTSVGCLSSAQEKAEGDFGWLALSQWETS